MSWVTPTITSASGWEPDATLSCNNNLDDYAYNLVTPLGPGNDIGYDIVTGKIYSLCNCIHLWLNTGRQQSGIDQMIIDAYIAGGWEEIYNDTFDREQWFEVGPFPPKRIAELKIHFWNNGDLWDEIKIYEIQTHIIAARPLVNGSLAGIGKGLLQCT